MLNVLSKQAGSYSHGTFPCSGCKRDFEAQLITGVDAGKTPRVKQALLNREFNILQCPHCGNRAFSNTPFFYEDFEGKSGESSRGRSEKITLCSSSSMT